MQTRSKQNAQRKRANAKRKCSYVLSIVQSDNAQNCVLCKATHAQLVRMCKTQIAEQFCKCSARNATLAQVCATLNAHNAACAQAQHANSTATYEFYKLHTAKTLERIS